MDTSFSNLAKIASERGAQRLANQTMLANSLANLQKAQGGLYGTQAEEIRKLMGPRAAAFRGQAAQGFGAANLSRAQAERFRGLLPGEMREQDLTNQGLAASKDILEIFDAFGLNARNLTGGFNANFGTGMPPAAPSYPFDPYTGDPIIE